MSPTLFPIIQPQASAENTSSLDLFMEIKWDFDNDIPVFRSGSPVIVTGKEAVMVWAWKALHTPRFRYEIYTWNYGNEMQELIGQPFIDELKRAEATRYIKECLMVSPYISDVTDVTAAFTGTMLSITAKIWTIYGEVDINDTL